jgi:GDPmannose 4,6-dehydratase
VDLLVGDASRARELLGWRPQLSFEDLVRRMVTWDVHRAHRALEQSQAAAPDFSS